jgi:hypothetical protein
VGQRVGLIKTIEGFGCVFVRHGGKHDWYRHPADGVPGRNLPSKVPPDNGLQFDARATEAEALGRFAASATLSAYV